MLIPSNCAQILQGKMIMKEFICQRDESNQFVCRENAKNIEPFYSENYERTSELMMDVCAKLYAYYGDHNSVEKLSAENITSWKDLFQLYMMNLHLDRIHDSLSITIVAAVCSPFKLHFQC